MKEAARRMGTDLAAKAEILRFRAACTVVFPLASSGQEVGHAHFNACMDLVIGMRLAGSRVKERLGTDICDASDVKVVTAEDSPLGVPSLILGKCIWTPKQQLAALVSIADWKGVAEHLRSYAPRRADGSSGGSPVAFVFDSQGNKLLLWFLTTKVVPNLLALLPEFTWCIVEGRVCLSRGINWMIKEDSHSGTDCGA
jgi:hypothetical protein